MDGMIDAPEIIFEPPQGPHRKGNVEALDLFVAEGVTIRELNFDHEGTGIEACRTGSGYSMGAGSNRGFYDIRNRTTDIATGGFALHEHIQGRF